MKKGLFYMAIALVLTIFGCKETPTAKTTAEAIVEKVAVSKEGAQNVLTEAETKEGYQLLFDGKTMHGWRNFKKQTIGKDWIVDSIKPYTLMLLKNPMAVGKRLMGVILLQTILLKIMNFKWSGKLILVVIQVSSIM
jgi:hypothetical protein